MREEYELEVLEQYDIIVKSTRRIRGAFFCDTEEGAMLLKETRISAQRAPLLYLILSRIEGEGKIMTDTPVFTREGGLVAVSREGTGYMLKKWFRGRECDIRQEKDVLKASGILAELHRETEDFGTLKSDIGNEYILPAGRNPLDEIARHNRELKKVRSFIRSRATKNEFESLFLESFEQMYHMAERTLERMQESECGRLFDEHIRNGSIVHGDYNYHNLIMLDEGAAVTNFEHMHADIPASDFYYLIRKVMEKNEWKQKTGQNMLEAYEEKRKLSPAEKKYIALRLAYPEKFWKAASGYYHSSKVRIPEKSIEKLSLAVRQTEEKRRFLEAVFSVEI